MSIDYTPPGQVARSFMLDNSFFRGLMGPVGSGKSVACLMDTFRRALAQAPNHEGRRKSRWGVVRNTNPQLKTSTIKTWQDWFPEHLFGHMNMSPPFTHAIELPMPDGTVMEGEWIFLALDTPTDVRKLLSTEFTGIFINEAREVPKAIIDACTMRVGRFPSMRDEGPSWYGVLADTNAPASDHWWPIMAGDVPPPEHMTAADRSLLVRPADWRFFRQPPAMLEERDTSGKVTNYKLNPGRENKANLTPEYYPRIISGKNRPWVNVYVLNRYDELFEGRPVYPTFNRDAHVSQQSLQPVPGEIVYVGLDFGLMPAATFGQIVRGQHQLQRECIGVNIGLKRFITDQLRPFIEKHYPAKEFELRIIGDPSGDNRVGTDEETSFAILNANGFRAYPASSNDFAVRTGAVEEVLGRMIEGRPGYVVSGPDCPVCTRAFEGAYCYPEGRDRPVKDGERGKWSHPMDAEQYRILGTGVGDQLLRGGKPAKVQQAETRFSPRTQSSLRRAGFKPEGLR